MNFPRILSPAEVEALEREWLGQRVELEHTPDAHTHLKPGDRGEVTVVDGLGTLHMRWDNGSTLGLVPGEDRFRRVEQ